MSDLVGTPNCWLSHAAAQLLKKDVAHVFQDFNSLVEEEKQRILHEQQDSGQKQ